jgi:uncharacterized protein (DUF952 family)
MYYKLLIELEYICWKQQDHFIGSPYDIYDGYIHLCAHYEDTYTLKTKDNYKYIAVIDDALLDKTLESIYRSKYIHYYGRIPFSAVSEFICID